MRRRTFIGNGIPPRASTCDADCGAAIAIGQECWANENGARDECFCSIACYAKHYPHDPALPAVPPKAAARPADDDNDTW